MTKKQIKMIKRAKKAILKIALPLEDLLEIPEFENSDNFDLATSYLAQSYQAFEDFLNEIGEEEE